MATALRDAARTAVLGVGSELRGDDAAGVRVAQALIERLEETPSDKLGAFVGSSAPENLTGAVAAYGPSHLVLVDAAELGLAPGEMQLIDPQAIAGTSFSTHMLPLRIILDYLAESVGCEVVVVGIQPAGTEFLAELSAPVRASVERVVETLLSRA